MAGNGQLPQSQKPTIKYKHNQTGGAFIELVESNRQDYAPSYTAINQHNVNRNESKSAEIVRTSDLVAAIGHLWDRAILPQALKSKPRERERERFRRECQKGERMKGH